jgi:c-di-GMP-binding flagellar brake protein YcgR
MDQPEIIYGEKLLEMLKVLSESRRFCKMEIPHTNYGWITLVLGLQPVGSLNYLLIDKVAGFEQRLSRSQNQEISVEFLETDGVPCQFKARVFECRPEAIWVELPTSLYRIQKRKFFRVKARLGTAIVFHLDQAMEEKADVKDYSLGGVAFFMDRHLKLTVGDQLKEVELRIPQRSERINFHIPLATVRRLEPQMGGKDICALEFLEMSDATRELLWRHIFREQRMFLRKTRGV